jgi:hypothetical protein
MAVLRQEVTNIYSKICESETHEDDTTIFYVPLTMER